MTCSVPGRRQKCEHVQGVGHLHVKPKVEDEQQWMYHIEQKNGANRTL